MDLTGWLGLGEIGRPLISDWGMGLDSLFGFGRDAMNFGLADRDTTG